MSDQFSEQDLYNKHKDILFCLTMLQKQAAGLDLPEVVDLIAAARLAAREIEIKPFIAANENDESGPENDPSDQNS